MPGTKSSRIFAVDLDRANTDDEIWFRFSMYAAGTPKIEIRNVAGELQKTLNLGSSVPPGRYASRGRAYFWDRLDSGSSRVGAGTYFADFYFSNVYQTRTKFILS